MQNDFKPTTFNGEPLTTAKLNQLANNVQYLFDRAPKVRYTSPGVDGKPGIIRDNALKMISGKTIIPATTTANYVYVTVNFGSYFSAGCKPIVQATIESARDAYLHRSHVVIQGLTGGEVDVTGFTAIVANETYKRQGAGWVHWTATGY